MNEHASTLKISEGKTFNYLIPIILFAILSLVSFVLFWPLGILLAAACVLLGSIESGLEFNTETMQYRKYQALFGSSRGKWVQIEDPDSFHVRLSVDSISYRTFAQLSSPSYYGRNTVAQSKSITYDLLYLSKNDHWVTIYEFSSYKLVLKAVKKLQELESCEVVDHIALKLQENQQKRMNRMR
ncbi:hypothetical protein D3C87_21990 [compost metagenome]